MLVWAGNVNSIKKFLVSLKNSLRIRNAHTSNLFKNLKVLNLPDLVTLENCFLICKYFNQSLPKTFKNCFTPATASHTHNTRWSNLGCPKIASHDTKLYARHSVNTGAIYTWKYLQKLHVSVLIYQLPLTKFKSLIKKYYTSNHN